MAWIESHFVLCIAIWVAAGSIAKIVATRTKDEFPRVSGVALAIAGLLSDSLQVVEGLASSIGVGPKPPPPASPGAYRHTYPATPDAAPTDPDPDLPPRMRRIVTAEPRPAPRRQTLWWMPPMLNAIAIAVLALWLTACAFFRDAKNERDAAQLPICVLQHITEPPPQIMTDCAGATLVIIADVIEAETKAEAAKHPGGCK